MWIMRPALAYAFDWAKAKWHAFTLWLFPSASYASQVNIPQTVLRAAQVLGVPVDAPKREIKKAFIEKGHPDHCTRTGQPKPDAEVCRKMHAAYKVLMEYRRCEGTWED